AMLEAIVQHEHLALQLLHRNRGEARPIDPLQMRHVGQVLFQDHALIIEAAGAGVASTEDGHASVLLAVVAGNVFYTRRLARATGGQVADADDRHFGPANPLPAHVVQAIPHADCPAVGDTRQPQATALCAGPDAAGLPTNQGSVTLA